MIIKNLPCTVDSTVQKELYSLDKVAALPCLIIVTDNANPRITPHFESEYLLHPDRPGVIQRTMG
jgi:hypothetical protein